MVNHLQSLDKDKPQGFPSTSCILSRQNVPFLSSEHAKKRMIDGDVILYIDETGIYINVSSFRTGYITSVLIKQDFDEDGIEAPVHLEHWRAVGCFRHDDPNINRELATSGPVI
jgi:hypothetical protein